MPLHVRLPGEDEHLERCLRGASLGCLRPLLHAEADERGRRGGCFDGADRVPDARDLPLPQVFREVPLVMFEVVRDRRQLRNDRLGVGAVAEQDLHQFRRPLLAVPPILVTGVVDTRFDPLLDVVLREQAKPLDANRVGEHLPARGRLDDRPMDRRQQRLDLLGGEDPVDRSETAPRSPVLVLQPGPHSRVQSLAVNAIDRLAEQALAIEQCEGEIPLLHAAGVVDPVHLGHEFEQLRDRRRGGGPDPGQGIRRLDAEPEVLLGQALLKRFDGRSGPRAESPQRLTRTVASFKFASVEQLHDGRNRSLFPAGQRHPRSLANDRRPTAEALDELIAAACVVRAGAVLVVPPPAVGDQGFRSRGIE